MLNLNIRNASLADLDCITEIEGACFPVAEAANKDIIKKRLNAYSKGFLVGEINNKVVGFINGGAFNARKIEDEFFSSMTLHKDENKSLVIFGLDVHPNYQKQGIATELMKNFIKFAKSEKKDYILLTCKKHLINFYESFGYVNDGISKSNHGGAKWYDMTLKLKGTYNK